MAAFLQLKRRLYLRNTPESVGDEWKSATDGGLKCISNTIRLRFTGVERGFYNEQERKVSRRPDSKENNTSVLRDSAAGQERFCFSGRTRLFCFSGGPRLSEMKPR
jgi:hypothetical protein